jgi:hypothetical protein
VKLFGMAETGGVNTCWFYVFIFCSRRIFLVFA